VSFIFVKCLDYKPVKKTNELFGTKLGRRDYIGMIYKLTEFGADRLQNGAPQGDEI